MAPAFRHITPAMSGTFAAGALLAYILVARQLSTQVQEYKPWATSSQMTEQSITS